MTTYDDNFSDWWRGNRAIGEVTDVPIAADHEISMMWENGKAMNMEFEQKTCTYDESYCYKAQTVPSIHSVSANQGWTTGGIDLHITGSGFDSGTKEIMVDQTPCEIKWSTRDAL